MLSRVIALVLAAIVVSGCGEQPPSASAPSTQQPPSAVVATPDPRATSCSEFANQAAAQRAANTRDPDNDGLYCESLSCPCAGSADGGGTAPRDPVPTERAACVRPRNVQPIGFSATKFPRIRAHTRAAIRRGWPSVLVLNRAGAAARRAQLLAGIPTRAGHDRDEYPPAVGRGRGAGLARGAGPRGWKADVDYVPSSENRSHGSILGIKLRRFCDGTRFRYVFY